MSNYIIKTMGSMQNIAHELNVMMAIYGKNTKLIDMIKKENNKKENQTK